VLRQLEGTTEKRYGEIRQTTLTARSADLSLGGVYLFDPEKLIETSSDAEMNPKFVVDFF
jgi:hypothetical protein